MHEFLFVVNNLTQRQDRTEKRGSYYVLKPKTPMAAELSARCRKLLVARLRASFSIAEDSDSEVLRWARKYRSTCYKKAYLKCYLAARSQLNLCAHDYNPAAVDKHGKTLSLCTRCLTNNINRKKVWVASKSKMECKKLQAGYTRTYLATEKGKAHKRRAWRRRKLRLDQVKVNVAATSGVEAMACVPVQKARAWNGTIAPAT